MQAAAALPDQDQAAAALIRAEKSAFEHVRKLRDDLMCRRPSGFGLSRQLHERWNAYQEANCAKSFVTRAGDKRG
jgi:hypothetical protein